MNTLVFKTKKEALGFLKSVQGLESSLDETFFYPKGTYYLSHGEYAKPDYQSRRYRDGWGIHVKYYFYDGTCYAPKDGRIDAETFYNRFGD